MDGGGVGGYSGVGGGVVKYETTSLSARQVFVCSKKSWLTSCIVECGEVACGAQSRAS